MAPSSCDTRVATGAVDATHGQRAAAAVAVAVAGAVAAAPLAPQPDQHLHEERQHRVGGEGGQFPVEGVGVAGPCLGQLGQPVDPVMGGDGRRVHRRQLEDCPDLEQVDGGDARVAQVARHRLDHRSLVGGQGDEAAARALLHPGHRVVLQEADRLPEDGPAHAVAGHELGLAAHHAPHRPAGVADLVVDGPGHLVGPPPGRL